jgi:hypothetical protein
MTSKNVKDLTSEERKELVNKIGDALLENEIDAKV